MLPKFVDINIYDWVLSLTEPHIYKVCFSQTSRLPLYFSSIPLHVPRHLNRNAYVCQCLDPALFYLFYIISIDYWCKFEQFRTHAHEKCKNTDAFVQYIHTFLQNQHIKSGQGLIWQYDDACRYVPFTWFNSLFCTTEEGHVFLYGEFSNDSVNHNEVHVYTRLYLPSHMVWCYFVAGTWSLCDGLRTYWSWRIL